MSTKVNLIFNLTLMSVMLFLVMIGCAGTGAVVIEDERGRIVIESEREGYNYPDEHYSIPPGHMPPPEKCHIWYPDLPPGQQPPPGDCEELRYQVPPGAWLIGG